MSRLLETWAGETAAAISRKGIPQKLNLLTSKKTNFLSRTPLLSLNVLSKTVYHARSIVWTLNLCCIIFSADETTVMISREVNTQESGFAYFIGEKFSHLNITTLVKRTAENSLSCAFFCLNNLACFSFNFAAFPDKAGKFTCELLSSDKYNNSEGFLPSKTFHHFSIVVSNLSLEFVLKFGEPECLIKLQLDFQYAIERSWQKEVGILFSFLHVFLKTEYHLL